MITKQDARSALQEAGSLTAAAKKLGMPRSSLWDLLHLDKGSYTPPTKSATLAKADVRPAAGRSLTEFRAAHDKDFIVPGRIREALKTLGDGWDYEVPFAKAAGVSLADLGVYREQFADHVVVVRRDGKRAWAGKASTAAKMREMVR